MCCAPGGPLEPARQRRAQRGGRGAGTHLGVLRARRACLNEMGRGGRKEGGVGYGAQARTWMYCAPGGPA
eukprot:358848-Chlamydomonas_euryale.AAC.16